MLLPFRRTSINYYNKHIKKPIEIYKKLELEKLDKRKDLNLISISVNKNLNEPRKKKEIRYYDNAALIEEKIQEINSTIRYQ